MKSGCKVLKLMMYHLTNKVNKSHLLKNLWQGNLIWIMQVKKRKWRRKKLLLKYKVLIEVKKLEIKLKKWKKRKKLLLRFKQLIEANKPETK